MNTSKTPTILAATALALAVFGSTSIGSAAGRLILPHNSVGSAQLKLGAVTAAKIKDGTLTAAKFKVGEHALLKGVGAGGFATAHTRYAAANAGGAFVTHAHSYPIETFADLGLLGLLLSLALLVSWGVAAMRAIGVTRWTPPERAAERDGLITLLVVVIVFGLNSAIITV